MTVRRASHFAIGHTLIELAIAMALSLVVAASAVALYRTQRAAFSSANDAMHMRDAASTALTLIGQQIQMAGFVPADTGTAIATTLQKSPALFGCSGARVSGTDDAPACEALASHSDGVLVRYVGDAVSTWPTATGQATDCLGQSVAASLTTDTPGAFIVNRFYAKTSGSTGEPELYCEGSGKANSAQPLMEGVERIRLRYWLADAADARDASTLRADEWLNVIAVDVCVQVRGAAQTRRSTYVDCDGVKTVGADTRLRATYMRRVALRNRERSV